MEVRVDRLDQPDWKYNYNGYSVKIGGDHDHRVLTLTTGCPMTLMKWLKQVLKTVNTKYGVLTVGMSVDEPKDAWEKEKMVQICTGSHCFIFILPPKEELARQGGYGFRMAPALQMLRKFFASPKVFAVAPADGTKMGSLLKVLNEEYEIVVSNPVEVVGAATLAQKAKEIGIREYWPTIAAAASNGPWYEEWGVPLPVNFGDGDMFTDQKVMYCAFKTYLCFLIANDNLDHQFKPHPSPASTSAPNNKKIKKKKKKN